MQEDTFLNYGGMMASIEAAASAMDHESEAASCCSYKMPIYLKSHQQFVLTTNRPNGEMVLFES